MHDANCATYDITRVLCMQCDHAVLQKTLIGNLVYDDEIATGINTRCCLSMTDNSVDRLFGKAISTMKFGG